MGCVNRLTRLFNKRYAENRAVVSIQNPVRVGDFDLPQPDVALLEPRADFYGTRMAMPQGVLLLVEVSDSTLRIDLGRKARRAGTPVGAAWDAQNGSAPSLHPTWLSRLPS